MKKTVLYLIAIIDKLISIFFTLTLIFIKIVAIQSNFTFFINTILSFNLNSIQKCYN